MDRLLRKPYLSSLGYEEVIDHTVDFMELIGVPDIFEEVHYAGEFRNYKINLPCELTEEVYVFVNGQPAFAASDPRHPYMGDTDFKFPPTNSVHHLKGIHKGEHHNYRGHPVNPNGFYTYKLKHNVLFLNIPTGYISVIGVRIKIDENGEVMIPDDRLFLMALQQYIVYKKMEDKFLSGTINRQLLDVAEQEYMWLVGKLEASYKMINYAQAATIFNALHTLRNKPFDFGASFSRLPSAEIVKIHN